MGRPTVVIKKYANRRLYDTTGSRYVNLDEIAGMVQKGEDVQVLDALTGQDLTRVILTQIITENAKERPTGLPLELLRQIIMASDQVGQEFLTWYLKSAFDTYQKVQDAVQNRLSEVQSAILSPVEMMRRFLNNPAPTGKTEPESEVAELRKRLAELEARLNQSGKTKPRTETHRKKRLAKSH